MAINAHDRKQNNKHIRQSCETKMQTFDHLMGHDNLHPLIAWSQMPNDTDAVRGEHGWRTLTCGPGYM